MKGCSEQLPGQGFGAVYQDLAPKILRYVLRLCGNSEMAEEIVQETFLAMYTHLDSFQGRSSVATWAYKIATNKFIDHRRNAWAKVATDSERMEKIPCNVPNPEKQILFQEEVQRLRTAWEKLPPEQKTALHLVRFEGLKYREAADVLETNLTTVRMRVYYGLLALKRSLDAY